MSATEQALREALDEFVADLKAHLEGTTPTLKARGVALGNAAKDLGEAVFEKRITWDVARGRLKDIGDAVKSEALAQGYDTQAAIGAALTKAATAILKIASVTLGGIA